MFRRNRFLNPEQLGAWKRDTAQKVGAVTGCFFMIAKDTWEAQRGFDCSFFMYGEETDLCQRIARGGGACWICPEAKLIHYGGASEKVRADKMIRLFSAKALLMEKHWSAGATWLGIKMLRFWALSRMSGLFVVNGAKRLLHRDGPKSNPWTVVWRRRDEFSRPEWNAHQTGYPSE